MFKRIIPIIILLALFAGQAGATISGTCYVDSLAAWDTLRVRLTTSGEAPDSVVACKLWGSGLSDFEGNFTLWGTVSTPNTHLDTLFFGQLPAFTKFNFRWEIDSYDTTLATGSRTTMRKTYTSITSGYTKHHPTPRVVAADTTGCDSTINAMKVLLRLPLVAPDSAAVAWQLYMSTTNPPGLGDWADSATAINKVSDTSSFITLTKAITSLYNGTKYYFIASVNYQDTLTGNRAVNTYWTAVDSGYTKTIGQTVAQITDSSSWRNFQVSDVWFSDTALVTLAMQYRVNGITTWTMAAVAANWANNKSVGRDSTGLGSPDSLWALTGGVTYGTGTAASLAPWTDLLPNTTYDVRVIGYYGTAAAQAYRGSDTSNTITITTPTLPGYKTAYDSSIALGYFGPNIFHFTDTWIKLDHAWTSPQIDISQYGKIRVAGSMFGWDNNHPGDSTKIWLRTNRTSIPQGWACFDSSLLQINNRPIADTFTFVKNYTLGPPEYDSLGSKIWFYDAVEDSNTALGYGGSTDTTTLNRHYIDIWVTCWPKVIEIDHNIFAKSDSFTFLAGGTYPADTSSVYDIGFANSLSMILNWAGYHATDSSTFQLLFQVSEVSDTNYYNWKTVGSAVACSTLIGGGSPVGVGVKVAYLAPDSIGLAAGAGGAVTSALRAAIGAKYFRWILIQTQKHTEPTTNIDSAWVRTNLLRRK
jgi:hypothetical protein